MKRLLLLNLAWFIAAAIPAHAGDSLLKASVTGTVQTQAIVGLSVGRIHTTILNDKRIFEEFQVSKTDYQLCVVTSGSGSLLLVPKHTGANLPTITVIGIGTDEETVIDTQARVANFVSAVDKGAATNLFENAAGEAAGTIHFKGTLASPTITKYNYSVTGHGTDQVAHGSALLKFKVTTAGAFVPAP